MSNKLLSVVGLGALALAVNANEASATEQNDCVVTTSVLNVRSGPGTDKDIIGKVYDGNRLTILESEGIWYKVKLSNNSEGWVSGSYVKLVDGANATYKENKVKQGRVTTAALNVRSGVGTNNAVVGKLLGGTTVDLLDTSNGWYKVKLSNGTVGWCSGLYISVTAVDTAKDKVESVVVETEDKGTTSQSYIDYSNSTKVEEGLKGYVTATALNVRGGVGVKYSIVTTLLYATEVDLLEESAGWYKVKLSNGTIGWCSGAYLSKAKVETVGSNTVDVGNATESSVINKREAIVNIAKEQLGKPYVWGASGTESFDCSSFTQYVYKQALGVNIPRVSYDQARFGKDISVGNFEIGDLIYLDTSGVVDGKVTHVGIYIGNGKMIHASGTKDNPRYVMITPIDSGWYKDRVLGARRLI